MLSYRDIMKYASTIKVLYVDDDQPSREITTILLENFFSNITIVTNGEEGLNSFKEKEIDLIITDINMPKLNGLDMIKKIKSIKPNISVLILSAYSYNEYFIQSIKLDIDGYILKPIENKQFTDMLFKVIKKIQIEKQFKENQLLLKQYQNITNRSAMVSKTDINGNITFVNEAFCKFYGYTREELLGKNHNIIKHPNNPKEIYEKMWKQLKNKQPYKDVLRNMKKNQDSCYLQALIEPIIDTNNQIIEFISLQTDITDIMNPRKQLENFVDTTSNILAIMIKIEGYDEIEKLYGEAITRKITNQLSLILENNTNLIKYKFEKIFILGEGNYVFVSEQNNYNAIKTEFIKDIKNFQNKINNIVIKFDNIEYDISILISVAWGDDLLDNLRYGIDYLEETKQTFIEAYDLAQNIRKTTKQNMEIINLIKEAIEDNRIVSYFQPLVDNKTQQIIKYESLVRLIKKDGTVLSPFFFLDISKRGRYYSQITKIVLKNSFLALEKTTKDISMNLSALDIESTQMQQYIFSLLDKYKHYASRIVFELLEDEAVKDFKTIKQFISKAKAYGVKIAIDDFGAGYSNFERLLDYQPDILKIDGCLIKDILTDKYSLSIVKTIVTFAKGQNMQIVAEFVETKEVFELLKSLGIDFTQGYYFGKPTPLNEEK